MRLSRAGQRFAGAGKAELPMIEMSDRSTTSRTTVGVGRRFTLGLSVEHFDFRVDLHRFIETLSEQVDVVVFTDRPFAHPVKGLKELRLYRWPRNLVAAIVTRFFLVFRRLPKSRNNFFITEMFGLAQLPPARQKRGLFYLRLRRLLPWGVSVDTVLPWLGGGDATSLEGVDAFLHITRIGSLPFLRRALTSGKPNAAYIYSWDHPCKHTTIPRGGMRAYFTWNRGLSEDLADLQGVEPRLIREVGATQLAPLKQYLETPAARQRLVPGDYVYYGCGTGTPDLVRQEVAVILQLAVALREVAPQTVLLVRPYPNLLDWSCYDALRRESNVRFDWFRQEGQGRELSAAQVFEKYNKVEHARAFVHLGTTLGWEACYFDRPVLFLAMDDFRAGSPGAGFDLRHFIHQYHNDRYMILNRFPNVVRRAEDLPATLRDALNQPAGFLAYNRAVADATPLRSLSDIAAGILKELVPTPAT